MAILPGPCRCCDKTSIFLYRDKEYIGFDAAMQAQYEYNIKALKEGDAYFLYKNKNSQLVFIDEKWYANGENMINYLLN